jgi:hypothetical protein
MEPTFSIRGFTGGASTGFEIDVPGISGLGIPVPRGADQEDGDGDGDVGGDDSLPKRVLAIPVLIDRSSSALVVAAVRELKRAWRPVRVSGSEVALDLSLPDEELRFYGRPRGFDADLRALKSGHADVLLGFDALDPFGYGPEVVVPLAAGTTIVESDGDAPSRRWSLELARTGAAVSFDVDEDEEPGLSLSAGSSTLALDGRAKTITEAGTVIYPVEPGSGWPTIVDGTNTITLTGATGTLVYRAAYH